MRCARLFPTLCLATGLAAVSHAADFTAACTNPSSPGQPTAIDGQCGLEGAAGDEAQQNAVKNSFCASGPSTVLNFTQFRDLQTAVEQRGAINFGDRANHGSHGPTIDRSPLKELGEGRLVQVQGYVLAAKQEGAESVNCGHDFDNVANKDAFHDIHISLVETPELARPSDRVEEAADECQGIVAEMIPHHRPKTWTAANVNKVHAAQLRVRLTGQLFFDSSHVPCAAGKAVRTNPKRFSLWEIHPIYTFEVCTADCDREGKWMPLEQWLQQ